MEIFHLDEHSKLHVIPSNEMTESEELSSLSRKFTNTSFQFQDSIKILSEKLDSLTKKVENKKLLALGLKAKLKSFNLHKETQKTLMTEAFNDKKKMRDNLDLEIASLKKILQKQKQQIDELKERGCIN